ncbi:hypothetical protein AG1IA_01219 [Rhizoctonia solani AG-1 IA]|uniref:Uncharacterized protein n=1 Tax=Thanatephorus cucumeris (strain AG1-IA) TaxID=983506 RepID=L8X6R7_THACA|nr:hypothetical protein AG1IA_01219 [Rhizoctonia solani AG-1 IA]
MTASRPPNVSLALNSFLPSRLYIFHIQFMSSTAETGEISDQLTNLAAPLSSATITVRVIKSFEYRTEKSLVIHALDLEHTTVGELKERVPIKTEPGWKPYRTVQLDTLKLYTKAHGTTNLIINLDHDDWILNDDSAILASLGFENETEVSFFNRELYEAFKKDPT